VGPKRRPQPMRAWVPFHQRLDARRSSLVCPPRARQVPSAPQWFSSARSAVNATAGASSEAVQGSGCDAEKPRSACSGVTEPVEATGSVVTIAKAPIGTQAPAQRNSSCAAS
jgi:hypothetical protein